MSSSLYSRGNAIVPIAALVTLAAFGGYFYKLNADGKAIVIASAADIPDGLIADVRADGLEISAAKQGGNHGPIKIKLGAAVTDLRKDLVLRADGSVGPDTGTGARVVVARPLETGAVDETIEAVLIMPRKYGAAVVDGTTNGACAAAADLAALKAETELMGDALRALIASAAAAGIGA